MCWYFMESGMEKQRDTPTAVLTKCFNKAPPAPWEYTTNRGGRKMKLESEEIKEIKHKAAELVL